MKVVDVAAADLGASSGRVVLGRVGPQELQLVEAHRFATRSVDLGGVLHWDTPGLYLGILDGLRACLREADADGIAAIGVDSWAVDYGLLDRRGNLVGMPVCYRDTRTQGFDTVAFGMVPEQEVYATTGIQRLGFNTAMQLLADKASHRLDHADRLLMLPDLFTYWLTGVAVGERTNASTTQIYDPRTRDWAWSLVDRWGFDRSLLPRLLDAGTIVGPVQAAVADELFLGRDVPVVAVGSHDTASAVVAVPAAEGERCAYISCGTWSLVGVELDSPVLTQESREANFTNEVGVDDTIRYLRNVMGLWLLTQSQRTWERSGEQSDLQRLLADAARSTPLRSLVDTERPVFLPPGHMPERIVEECRRTGEPEPRTTGETTRCILDSLALAYRRAIDDAQRLSGQAVDVVRVVGGGCRNELLMQLTADATGLPVVAGPVEASALGNVLVQARAIGVISGGLPQMRQLVRASHDLVEYQPDPSRKAAWDAALARATH